MKGETFLIRHGLALPLSVFAALCILFATTDAFGQQIGSGISTKEAFIDSQIVFQIKVAISGDALKEFSPPKPPQVDGLDIASAGAPSRSSSIRIVNGRRSASSTLTYSYFVTPKREGTFTLPSVNVTVEGKQLSTKPHTFVVSKSETGDLLFVEVEGETKQAYVGEAVKLKLKIWLRGFSDREQRIQLDERTMWQCFSQNRTEWGTFGDRLNELAAERKRPAGQDALRKDSEGVSRAYLLYEIETTMYPKRPGQIDPGNVRIVVDYPTKVSPPRRSFGGSIFGPSLLDEMMGGGTPIQATRPISAEATLPPIQIVDVPSKGRPADYRGAVGKYKLLIEADKRQVKVGEPIGLRIYIQGDGPMELVEAPPLATLTDLVEDFKVEDKALAGFVQGDAKAFATSIRPRSEKLTEIPPIPFSFFDPNERAFQTVYSAAIPISVQANESLSMDSIVANKKSTGPSSTNDFERSKEEASLLGVNEMLREPSGAEQSPNAWFAFAVAPLFCLIGLVVTRRSAVASWWRRKTDPLHDARERIRIADTASEIRDALSMPGFESNDVRSVQAECDQLTFNPDAERSHRAIDALKQKALSALVAQPLLWMAITCLLLFSGTSIGLATEPKLSLSQQQIKTILQEAYAAHLEAKEQLEIDPSNAKKRLATAIDKYELVAESGLKSFALQLNLGDAYMQNGESVKSLVAFEAARRQRPSSMEIQQRIANVRESIGKEAEDNGSPASIASLFRVIPRSVYWWLGLIAWTAFWLTVAVGLLVARTRRVIAVGVAVSLLLVAGLAFAAYRGSNSYGFDAIAAVDGAELRLADGEGFEVLHVVRLGEPLVVSDRRGDWLHVADIKSEKQGWVKAESVAAISH